MTKKIETLVNDIQYVLKYGKKISDDDALEFGKALAATVQQKLKPRVKRARGTLRMSNIGRPDRQLWYEVNTPNMAEDLHPNAYMKFLIGDIIEEVILFLAKEAGHTVEGQQKEVEIAGIKGHLDAVIDGVVGDVKSASPFSFQKFQKGLKEEDDAFGYRMQIQGYIEGTKDDPMVTDHSRGFFLPVQKVTGDITTDIHLKSNEDIVAYVERKKQVVNSPDIPERCYEPIPEGKSGNMKLGVQCSYCSFKKECWPGLRTFLYSNGPVFLTEVVREPNVFEVKDGQEA